MARINKHTCDGEVGRRSCSRDVYVYQSSGVCWSLIELLERLVKTYYSLRNIEHFNTNTLMLLSSQWQTCYRTVSGRFSKCRITVEIKHITIKLYSIYSYSHCRSYISCCVKSVYDSSTPCSSPLNFIVVLH